MASREQNERNFGNWQELPDGGRHYGLEISGHRGWRAKYCKEVDRYESTTRFWQEIYDDQSKLVQVHHKFPINLGHKNV